MKQLQLNYALRMKEKRVFYRCIEKESQTNKNLSLFTQHLTKGERQNYVVITLKTGDSGLLVLDEITPVDYDTSFSSVLVIERI